MLAARSNGHFANQAGQALAATQRAVTQGRIRHASGLAADILQATSPVARQLQDTNLWNYGRWAGKHKRPNGDKSRVNIVQEKLCDDIVNYIKPSLRRHEGCDLIDLYPGAGLWSQKLHETLRPRSHILMEPDDIYRPFLSPLLSKSGVKLVPQSGIVWKELSEVLSPAVLPYQVERHPSSPEATQRNDTLLVTANLAFHPRKRFRAFDSVSLLVLFQFITAIRASSLFQKYGLVRMLIWVGDSDRRPLVPRSVQARKRMAVEGELSTDWINEVATLDNPTLSKAQRFYRDVAIDMDSGRLVLERMGKDGTTIPAGRETRLFNDLREIGQNDRMKAGAQPATFDRPFWAELKDLEARQAAGELDETSADFRQLKRLRYQMAWQAKRNDKIQRLLEERDALVGIRLAGGVSEADNRETAWAEAISGLNKDLRNEYVLVRDNLHAFQQSPPVLSWDRRTVEPLTVQPSEFFPNVPCTLLDIQPKAMHPLLRATGPSSGWSSEVLEILLRGIMQHSSDPISKSLEGIWPGAADGVLPLVSSLRDVARGGCPLDGVGGELNGRSLNERQIVEILERWMRWPFRPSYRELVGRASDEYVNDTSEELGTSPEAV